jgi:hypothetical protein
MHVLPKQAQNEPVLDRGRELLQQQMMVDRGIVGFDIRPEDKVMLGEMFLHCPYRRLCTPVTPHVYAPFGNRKVSLEFYDRKGALLKTLTDAGYQQYPGNFWRAQSMNMVNHQNGKSTEVKWLNYAFNTGLTEQDFSRNGLKRRH